MTTTKRTGFVFCIVGAVGLLAPDFAGKASAAVAPAPTFTRDVAPILFKHCVICHRPGEIAAPVQLLTYDAARPWAKSIKEKVLTREMPPWPADPNGGLKFRNEALLSRKEIDTLAAWVDTGAARGSEADLPPTPRFAQGWLHPSGLPPDIVISMPSEFTAPANGQISYVRFLTAVPFPEDKWIAALQVRPGNPGLVHHMAITEVTLRDGMKPADLDAMALLAKQMGMANSLPGSSPAVTDSENPGVLDMLGVYTPGTALEIYRDDSAKLMKGGRNSYINFNIHYQPTGKLERDRSMIGLWFRPGPPTRQLLRVPGATKTIIVNGRELLTDAPGRKAEGTGAAFPPIPPNADNYEVIGITAYTAPITISQFQPHAHIRCSDVKYVVVYPDGREQTVLTVPKYNFHWQLAYDLETPLRLPAGSKLVVTAHYDNSQRNKYNPAPSQEVYFRDGENQSTDEMFTPFIQYSSDSQDPRHNANATQRKLEENAARVIEADGCLEQSAGTWRLTSATEPLASDQASSSAGVRTAEAKPLGSRNYELLGVGIFNPSVHNGQKVAVKGAWLTGTEGINVTSLQRAGAGCGK